MLKSDLALVICFFLAGLFPARDVHSASTAPFINIDVTLRSSAVQVKFNASSFKAEAETCFQYDPATIFGITVKDHANKKLETIQKDEKIFCFVPPKTKFSVSYKAKVSSYKGPINEESELSNMVLGKAVLLFGNRIFIRPVFAPEANTTIAARVKFKTVKLKHFITDLDGDSKDIEVHDIQKFLSSIVVAGEMENDDTRVEGKKYDFSFIGNWNRDSRKRVYKAYKAIAKKQLDLWGFMPSGHMMVSFIKTRAAKVGAGFQYNNAIVYILPENIDTNGTEFLKLLAHEHFHIWNGDYFKPAQNPKTDITWFHEGVTSYYALMTLVSAEIISEKEFLAYLSKTYMKYDSSYNTADTGTLEGLREFFIAMAVDIEILRASGLRSDMDNVLKAFRSKATILKKGYDNDAIIMELTKMGNWEISDFFGRYIYSKKKITMDPYFGYLGLKFSPGLVLVKDAEKESYSKWISR